MNPSINIQEKIKINFNVTLSQGFRCSTKGINVFVTNKNTKISNLGVIVSKKVSNLAVVRNKYRRILKEIFRLDFVSVERRDIVFVVNRKILDLDFNRIRKELSIVRKQIVNEKLDSNIVNSRN
jgi:ribonuclease P protein component